MLQGLYLQLLRIRRHLKLNQDLHLFCRNFLPYCHSLCRQNHHFHLQHQIIKSICIWLKITNSREVLTSRLAVSRIVVTATWVGRWGSRVGRVASTAGVCWWSSRVRGMTARCTVRWRGSRATVCARVRRWSAMSSCRSTGVVCWIMGWLFGVRVTTWTTRLGLGATLSPKTKAPSTALGLALHYVMPLI